MTQFSRFTTYVVQGSNRAAGTMRMVQTQPNWIVRVAIFTFLIVIGLPIALLILLAIILATLVFTVLAGANLLYHKVRGTLPGQDGRSNVKVIRRAE